MQPSHGSTRRQAGQQTNRGCLLAQPHFRLQSTTPTGCADEKETAGRSQQRSRSLRMRVTTTFRNMQPKVGPVGSIYAAWSESTPVCEVPGRLRSMQRGQNILLQAAHCCRWMPPKALSRQAGPRI